MGLPGFGAGGQGHSSQVGVIMFRLNSVRCGSRVAAAHRRLLALLLLAAFALAPGIATAQAPQSQSSPVSCNGVLPVQALRQGGGGSPGQQPDLLISKPCTVSTGNSYYYGNVNITAGGSLTFF